MTGTEPSTAGTNRGFGVDVGGSGVKGGIVDLDTGQLIGERFKLLTPQPATPEADRQDRRRSGQRTSAGPARWGSPTPAWSSTASCRPRPTWTRPGSAPTPRDVIGAELNGQQVTVLNDADAAGLAEERYGAGQRQSGVVVLLTFGTGIGSAVIHNGVLLPNTEFGHLEVGGKEAEHRAASSVKERKDWSYERWTEEVTKVLIAIENADLARPVHRRRRHQPQIRQMDPAAENRTPVVAAALLNDSRHRRRRDGRPTPTSRTDFPPLARCRPASSRYNGRRRPPTG